MSFRAAKTIVEYLTNYFQSFMIRRTYPLCGIKNKKNVDLVFNIYIYVKNLMLKEKFYREFFYELCDFKITCDFYLIMKMIISSNFSTRSTIPFLGRYDVRLRMGLNYPIIPQTRFSGRRDKTATPRERRASLARLDLGRRRGLAADARWSLEDSPDNKS